MAIDSGPTAAAAASAATLGAARDVPAALKKPKLDPGSGILTLENGVFSTTQASYPLKLLSPHAVGVRLAYMIAYGGGLVAGDHIHLDVTVGAGDTLALLTQGSTKVFRHQAGIRRPQSHLLHAIHHSRDTLGTAARGDARPLNTYAGGRYPADLRADEPEAPTSRQRMLVTVREGGTVFLLPDSISPFKDSRYVQAQRFVLEPGASALVLDWVNSGRGRHEPPPVLKDKIHEKDYKHVPTQADEVWQMEYYASINEVVVGGRVVARERMVLQDQHGNSIRDRLRPYHVYATVLVYGPAMAKARTLLDAIADNESQFQIPRPPGLVWSWSALDEHGGIIRLAAVNVEDIRFWLRSVLTQGGMADIVGESLWPRCL